MVSLAGRGEKEKRGSSFRGSRSSQETEVGPEILIQVPVEHSHVEQVVNPAAGDGPHPLAVINPVRKGSAQHPHHFQVFKKDQVLIQADHTVEVSAFRLAVGGEHPQKGTGEDIAFETENPEVVAGLPAEIVGLSLQESKRELLADLAGDLDASQHGDFLTLSGESDATAVVELDLRPVPLSQPHTKFENSGSLQKELSFLGEENGHPVKVDDLVVHFGLGKVGVQGEIQGQTRGQGKFQVFQSHVAQISGVPGRPRPG